MQFEASLAPVLEEAPQGFAHGAKGQFFPWDCGFGEQLRLDRLRPGREIAVEESGTVVEVQLPDANDIEHCEQALQFDACAGFLDGFTQRAFGRRFAEFHEAGGQRPQAIARLDVAAAEQHFVAPDRHGADDVERILVVDRAAHAARGALAVVVGRDLVPRCAAAGLAMLDAARNEHGGSVLAASIRPRRAWHDSASRMHALLPEGTDRWTTS